MISEILPGTLIDGYQVVRRLDRSHRNSVYLVTEVNSGNQFALKICDGAGSRAQEKAYQKFIHEAAMGNKVPHPDTVAYIAVKRSVDRHHLVMQYYPGQTLFRYANENPLPVAEIVGILNCLAKILHHVHCAGVIHCDVKPSNIIRISKSDKPRYVLIDFEGATEKEMVRSIRGIHGTPDFLAPERWDCDFDHRVDLYALGCMTFWLLTGNLPYKEYYNARYDIKDLTWAHRNAPIPDVRTINPHVPEWLSKIVQRLLAKNPNERYGSGMEICEALQQK